jgi:hypothetical protein
MSRVAAWEKLLSTSETEPIWRMFQWAYSVSSPLLVHDRQELQTILQSAEGTRQGDPFSAFVFALCMQRMYESAIEGLPNCHGIAVLDDFTLIGPAADVFKAFDRLRESAPSYNMQLQVNKCQVFKHPDPMTSDDLGVQDCIRSGCTERNLRLETRLELLGVMHGSDEEILEHSMMTTESHAMLFSRLTHAAMPAEIGYHRLRFCVQPRLSFLARTTQPELLTDAVVKFDKMMMDCFARMSEIDARAKAALEPSLTTEEIDMRLSLPIRMGGVGLRPVERIHHAAYFASLAATLPAVCASFRISISILPLLQHN